LGGIMPLLPVPPTDTRPFFRPVARALVDLLRGLPADAWDKPTIAGAWRVRDVVAHILDGTLRRVSFHRDGLTPPAPEPTPRTEREFVAFIDDLNRRWVDAARRMSPRVLTDLYELAGMALADFVETLPDDAPALFPVSWAGEAESAGWFDIGREFTELWHHQAQVREAVGAPALADPQWLHAVLVIALRGLPHAYRDIPATPGQAVTIAITGAAGGVFTLLRDETRFRLWAGEAPGEAARVTMSDDTAWRLFFNALPPARADELVERRGDPALSAPLLRARSVIV
jgi:uncharacterized protein (TIGR03083 family)